jgi:hypothetical protein
MTYHLNLSIVERTVNVKETFGRLISVRCGVQSIDLIWCVGILLLESQLTLLFDQQVK